MLLESLLGQTLRRSGSYDIVPPDHPVLFPDQVNPEQHSLFVCAILVCSRDLQKVRATLESLQAQFFPNCRALVFCDAVQEKELAALYKGQAVEFYPWQSLNTTLQKVPFKYIGIILAGDTWVPYAWAKIYARCMKNPLADVIYGDELRALNAKNQMYFFKPDWSPELLLSMNYIGNSFVVSRKAFAAIGGMRTDYCVIGLYDLLLRLSEHTNSIEHIPQILARVDMPLLPARKEQQILHAALVRRGSKGEVLLLKKNGCYRVRQELTRQPLVSIIMLTAYKQPGMLRSCLLSIVEKSTYANYEIILVDNSRGLLTPETVKGILGTEIKHHYLAYPDEFNFSRMNNMAAGRAQGEYLLFLNDDTEVITPQWLEALLEQAQTPGVGVVGGKLLYPDGSIQHGGIFLVQQGVGARHAFRYLRHEQNSYFHYLSVVRNCSAVTFACAMVARRIYAEMKGLDENLKIECNDVDFCLRVMEQGLRNVWTPFAQLYHKELVSRQKTHYTEDMAYHQQRWKNLLIQGDPYYNPHLSQYSDFYLPK